MHCDKIREQNWLLEYLFLTNNNHLLLLQKELNILIFQQIFMNGTTIKTVVNITCHLEF